MKILKRDFDAATAQAWSATECVIAQAIARIEGSPIRIGSGGIFNMITESNIEVYLSKEAQSLQFMFDVAWSPNAEPDVEQESLLFLIREMLPLEV